MSAHPKLEVWRLHNQQGNSDKVYDVYCVMPGPHRADDFVCYAWGRRGNARQTKLTSGRAARSDATLKVSEKYQRGYELVYEDSFDITQNQLTMLETSHRQSDGRGFANIADQINHTSGGTVGGEPTWADGTMSANVGDPVPAGTTDDPEAANPIEALTQQASALIPKVAEDPLAHYPSVVALRETASEWRRQMVQLDSQLQMLELLLERVGQDA